MRTPAEVGAIIRARREELGLTQDEAAKRGGIGSATWNVAENGRQTTYKRRSDIGIARALGWTLDSIERIRDGLEPVETGASEPPSDPWDRAARLIAELSSIAEVQERLRRGAGS